MRKLLTILLIGITPMTMHAKTWQVHPHNQTNSYSLKNTLTQANPYDTIIINAGIYRTGNLPINKPLTIIGKHYPLIDGLEQNDVLTIRANDVTIIGLHIKNSGQSSYDDQAGIHAYNATNIYISNCILKHNFFGILFIHCNHFTITNNQIDGIKRGKLENGNGLHCWKSSYAFIKNNYITRHRDGIYFEFVTHSIIKDNTATRNSRYGLHFMFSHNDNYVHNTFSKNGAGVAVMYSKNIKMNANHFLSNTGTASFGLLLKDIGYSIITHNKFQKNTIGIHAEGSNHNIITWNSLTQNGWAMRIMANCTDNLLKYNSFEGNSFDISTNSFSNENKFTNNYWDKYDGYDLNHDHIGDIPYHAVSVYSILIEKIPYAIIMLKSLMVLLLDKAEKTIPSLIPESIKDEKPLMKKPNYDIHTTRK